MVLLGDGGLHSDNWANMSRASEEKTKYTFYRDCSGHATPLKMGPTHAQKNKVVFCLSESAKKHRISYLGEAGKGSSKNIY